MNQLFKEPFPQATVPESPHVPEGPEAAIATLLSGYFHTPISTDHTLADVFEQLENYRRILDSPEEQEAFDKILTSNIETYIQTAYTPRMDEIVQSVLNGEDDGTATATEVHRAVASVPQQYQSVRDILPGILETTIRDCAREQLAPLAERWSSRIPVYSMDSTDWLVDQIIEQVDQESQERFGEKAYTPEEKTGERIRLREKMLRRAEDARQESHSQLTWFIDIVGKDAFLDVFQQQLKRPILDLVTVHLTKGVESSSDLMEDLPNQDLGIMADAIYTKFEFVKTYIPPEIADELGDTLWQDVAAYLERIETRQDDAIRYLEQYAQYQRQQGVQDVLAHIQQDGVSLLHKRLSQSMSIFTNLVLHNLYKTTLTPEIEQGIKDTIAQLQKQAADQDQETTLKVELQQLETLLPTIKQRTTVQELPLVSSEKFIFNVFPHQLVDTSDDTQYRALIDHVLVHGVMAVGGEMTARGELNNFTYAWETFVTTELMGDPVLYRHVKNFVENHNEFFDPPEPLVIESFYNQLLQRARTDGRFPIFQEQKDAPPPLHNAA